jgi:hypothetical protein
MIAFLKAVRDRVIGGYKQTLIGVGFGVLGIIIDQFVLSAQSDARPWVQAASALAVIVGGYVKSKAQPAPAP